MKRQLMAAIVLILALSLVGVVAVLANDSIDANKPIQGFGVHLGAIYVCGDANGDGTVNISDAVYLIAYIFAGGQPPCAACK